MKWMFRWASIIGILIAVPFLSLGDVALAQTQTIHSFKNNLTISSTGVDVIALQQILIDKGFLTSVTAPTGYFGSGTKTALKKLQAANGISPASGYVGPLTRAFLNTVMATLPLHQPTLPLSNPGQVLSASTSVTVPVVPSSTSPTVSTSVQLSHSYAQQFIDATSMLTSIDSYGYIEVTFHTAITNGWKQDGFDWTIPNKFIFGGDKGYPQIKTAFRCNPAAIPDIRVIGYQNLIFAGGEQHKCQMTITDVSGNVATREFDFSSDGPSAFSSKPISTSTGPVSTPAVPTSNTAITPIDINARSIVGLWCYFNAATGSILSTLGTGQISFQGTGVIVNPDGYILTAKHMVDQAWVAGTYESSTAAQALYGSLLFDHCDVGMPPTNYSVPTPQEIQAMNPGELVGPMRYRATVYFDPATSSMSYAEAVATDFSILRITGATQDCSTWFVDCSYSGPFPYSPVLYANIPPIGNRLFTYGYPVEASAIYSNLILKGAFGHLTGYDNGDTYFSTTPLVMHMTAEDVMGGRSGSPIYWNGYVAGILYARYVDEASSTLIGMPAIQKVLENNGMGNLLKTK